MNTNLSVAKFTISGTSDRFWNKDDFFKFLMLNQYKSIRLDVVPEAVCLTMLGIYEILDLFEFKSVEIATWNPLESNSKYRITIPQENYCFNSCLQYLDSIDKELHNWNLDKIFMCVYHRPTASKLAIASYADQYSSLIHFSIDTSHDNLVHFELDKLLHYDVLSVVRASRLIQTLPRLISPSDRYTTSQIYDFSDPITRFYKSIFVDLVGENHVSGNTFFPTEKTIRPILLKKPFIAFASKDFLAYLRQMGFRTFSDFWNEDYDGYEYGDRLKRIYKVIDYISSKSTKELEKMYWDMQYTLEYNYNLLVNRQYTTKITQL
jgi:hypothetical protein